MQAIGGWLIPVHNHRCIDPTPSQANVQMTGAIIDIAGPLGIAAHDHIMMVRQQNLWVVSGSGNLPRA